MALSGLGHLMKRFALILSLLLAIPTAALADAYSSFIVSNFCGSARLYYKLNETAGTTLANSCTGTGSSYNLTTSGSPSLNQSGVNASRGPSVRFTSASTQYAEVNKNDTGTGPLDFGTTTGVQAGCWIKTAATGSVEVVFGSNQGTGTGSDQAMWELTKLSAELTSFRIWQYGTLNIYYRANGSTTLSTGTWYLIAGSFTGSTAHTVTTYTNGTSEGSNSTDFSGGGGTFGSQQYIDIGRRNATTPAYLNSNVQDCHGGNGTTWDWAADYTQGIATSTNAWPFLTKRPELPRFRNDGWLEKVKSRGYMDGHFTPQAKEPLWLTVGWLPFSTLPPGNVR